MFWKDLIQSMRGSKKIFWTESFLVVIGLLFTSSCIQKKFDSKEELWAYVENVENEYSQVKTIKGIDFILTYRPTDVLVQQELNNKFTKKDIDSLRNKYNKHMYFNLSMSKNNQELLSSMVGNSNDFSAMVNQFAFGMGNSVHVYSETKDTIAIVDYTYPRMYGMSKSTSILFVYPRNKKLLENNFFHFTIEDMGFKTGEVRFKIPTKIIESEPQLNF